MNKGFSLLELLLVITIISILSIAGYVYYQNHLIKSYRYQAKITLVELATQFEQYHIAHGTYPANLEPFNIKTMLSRRYQFSVNSVSDYSYLLLATPINQQSSDKQCGTLGYNQLGIKSINGNGKLKDCW